MAVLQRATEKPASNVFIFNFAVANFTMANELELMALHIIWEMVVVSVSLKEFQKIDGRCKQDTHSQYTSVWYSLSAERTHTTRLAQELHCHLCALEKSLVIWCVSCLILGCLPFPSPRAPHLPHSLFLQRHKNICTTRATRKNTQYITHIFKLPQSTSCTVQNHSGVKTWVGETRAPQLPQKCAPHCALHHWFSESTECATSFHFVFNFHVFYLSWLVWIFHFFGCSCCFRDFHVFHVFLHFWIFDISWFFNFPFMFFIFLVHVIHRSFSIFLNFAFSFRFFQLFSYTSLFFMFSFFFGWLHF